MTAPQQARTDVAIANGTPAERNSLSSPHQHARRGHVCIFTSAHPTDDVRVNSKIAASLLDAGYDVTWIGPERAYFAPAATVDERIRYRFVAAPTGKLSRILSSPRIALAAARMDIRDVDWWYSPDPDAALVATMIARRLGGRTVFDIHEVFHGSLIDRWLGGRRLRLVRELVRRGIARICRRADLVIAVNESVLASYAEPSSRALVIRNCAPDWFSGLAPADAVASRPTDVSAPMRVIHGKMIPQNGTPMVLDALDATLDRSAGVRVTMFDILTADTSFSTDARQRISTRLADSVDLIAPVPHHDMPALLASADVGMIAYGRGLGEDSLPNRFFEYMAAGLALLVPSYSREMASVLDEERIGITADFDDPQDISRALNWLRDHPDERRAMGERARRAFVERHSWEAEFDRFDSAMQGAPT